MRGFPAGGTAGDTVGETIMIPASLEPLGFVPHPNLHGKFP
jgi:hypothetical protein